MQWQHQISSQGSISRRPQVTPTNDIQRAPDVFARRFRRERLSNSQWAEQIDDQTVSFAFDEVIESNFLMVRFDEGLEEVLAVVGEDEVSECVGVPIDIANFLDVEIHYEEKIKFARETEEKEEPTPHFIHETEAEDNSRCEEQIFIGKLDVSLLAPGVVSAIKEVPIGVKGYDDDGDGSCAKDDREAFGRGGCSQEHPVIVIRWLDGMVGYKMA